jgi:hypothetical protein
MSILATTERERPGNPDLDVVREERQRLEETEELERLEPPESDEPEEGDDQ